MRSDLRAVCRWLALPVLVLGGFYLLIDLAQHSNWHKERLYQQLLTGKPEQQLRAASALAHFGGEKQLLAGLRAESPTVRDLAQRALEYVWFRAAGNRAHQVVEKAFEAAEREDFQTALKLLDRLVREYPRYAEGWNRRASVYWQMGQYEKSIADCEKTLALNPNHYGAWQGIGVCRVQLGSIAEACRCLRTALKINPYDDATRRCLQKCEELLRVVPATERPAKRTDLI